MFQRVYVVPKAFSDYTGIRWMQGSLKPIVNSLYACFIAIYSYKLLRIAHKTSPNRKINVGSLHPDSTLLTLNEHGRH